MTGSLNTAGTTTHLPVKIYDSTVNDPKIIFHKEPYIAHYSRVSNYIENIYYKIAIICFSIIWNANITLNNKINLPKMNLYYKKYN